MKAPDVTASVTASAPRTGRQAGLVVDRMFTKPGVDPFSQVTWGKRRSEIKSPDGSKTIFVMEDVEAPESWSQVAVDIAADKYFRKAGVPGRGHEHSVRQIVTRVAEAVRKAGARLGGYFASEKDAQAFEDELKYMLVTQRGAFNSPAWFNVGLAESYGIDGKSSGNFVWDFETGSVQVTSESYTRPAASACFIVSVEDDLLDIARHVEREMRIFRFGGGSGGNYSRLRAEGESLSNGGVSSGLMSFLKVFDVSAGAIKSGGTTRRAAKLVCLDADHPDIEKFIDWKVREEEKALALIKAGYPRDFNGEAYQTVSGQNANNSVRLTDEFMQAVLADKPWETKWRTTGKIAATLSAKKLFRKIADAAHRCADPGLMFDTTINKWNPVINTGRIEAANPCQPAWATVLTPEGVKTFGDIGVGSTIWSGLRWTKVSNKVATGVKPVYAYRTQGGTFFGTENHRVVQGGKKIQVKDAVCIDVCGRPGMPAGAAKSHEIFAREFMGECDVYDITVEADEHTYWTDGLLVSNCNEFHFLQNTACNLSSLNIMKFMEKKDGAWRLNVHAFRHAARLFTLAKEIIVDYASYPTREIAQNSHDYRPLGLGYANLGAALMVQGVPYDSEDGCAFAAAVNSVLCGVAYETSAEIASSKGPFPGFAHNREPMLKVLDMHREAAHKLNGERYADIAAEGRRAWDSACLSAEKHGVRNGQVTVTAPTGCLDPNMLVPTSRGLARLGEIGDVDGEKWQSLDGIKVSTDDGPKTATKFYVNGATESVVTVRTANGYVLRGTPQHRVKIVAESGEWEWRRIGELSEGDRVPLQLGQLVGTPREVKLPEFSAPYLGRTDLPGHAPSKVSPDLAEFLGLFMSNGSLHRKGVRISVCASDKDVVTRLRELGASLFGLEAHSSLEEGCYAVQFNSTRLVEWFRNCGFSKLEPETSGKGHEPRVPSTILATNDKAVYTAFLRGLFEGDGTVSTGSPEFCSAYKSFIDDVKAILLAAGYPTSSRIANISEKSGKPSYRLRIANVTFNRSWLDDVGFVGKRKRDAVQVESSQSGKNDRIPVSEALLNRLIPVGHEMRKKVMAAWTRDDCRSLTRDMAGEIAFMHDDAEIKKLMGFYYDTIESTELGEIEPTFDLSVPENVTYVANGFVSHNTIGLMMDCDTTGIEPDFSLVKAKKMAGGGFLKIVNQSVDAALETLGYTQEQRAAYVKHVLEHGTLETAPGIKPEHLAVFDCANRSGEGTRFIEPMGHIRMLAAVQPFVSGSISKTVNVPEATSVEEIENLYMEAWKRGLKCVAIYRDNSKHSQPLSSSSKKGEKKETDAAAAAKALAEEPTEIAVDDSGATEVVTHLPRTAAQPVDDRSGHGPPAVRRHRLPKRRPGGFTHELSVGGQKLYLRTGEYADGSLGELFIDMHKDGATMRSLMNCFSIAISLGLQHGVPLAEFVDAFTFMKFEPAGIVDHPNVKMASSVVDAIFRVIAVEYLGEDGLEYVQKKPTPEEFEEMRARRALSLTVNMRSVMPLTIKDGKPAIVAINGNDTSPINGNGTSHGTNGTSYSGKSVTEKFKRGSMAEAQTCSRCGNLTIRTGTCNTCNSCGLTTGCG